MIFLFIFGVISVCTGLIILKDDFLGDELRKNPWGKDA